MDYLIILVLLALVVAVMAAMGFKMVRHAETMVVERLGKYHRTMDSGINILWPILDRSRQINWRYVDAQALISKVPCGDTGIVFTAQHITYYMDAPFMYLFASLLSA